MDKCKRILLSNERMYIKGNMGMEFSENFENLRCDYSLIDYFKIRKVKGFFDLRNGENFYDEICEKRPMLLQAFNDYKDGAYAYIKEAGEKLLSFKYLMTTGDTVNLGENFSNLPHMSAEKAGTINQTLHMRMVRGSIFLILAYYYEITRDERAVKTFNIFAEQFFLNYSLIIERPYDLSLFQYSENRDIMSTGWLILSYINLLYTNIFYVCDKDIALSIIKRTYFLSMQFLRTEKLPFEFHNYNLFIAGIMPYLLSKMLPEFSFTEEMEEKGKENILKHIDFDFYLNGKYSEHSIGYLFGATMGEMLYKVLLIAKENNDLFIKGERKEKIDKIFTLGAELAPPKEFYDTLGDQGYIRKEAVLKMGREFNNKASINYGKDKSVTFLKSINLSDAGYIVLKNSDYDKGVYMLISALDNPIGSGHDHLDMTSFSLTVKGKSIIGEPYAGKLYKKFVLGTKLRGYLYNQEAHNVVLCNGKSVIEDESLATNWYNVKPGVSVLSFKKEEESAYVKLKHSGNIYASVIREINLKDKEILIEDTVISGNKLEKPHISRLHFEKGVEILKQEKNIVYFKKDELNFKMEFTGDFTDYKIYKPEFLKSVMGEDNLYPVIDIHFKNNINHNTKLVTKITYEF